MTVQQVIGLALRLVALYLVFAALKDVTSGLYVSRLDGSDGGSVYYIGAVIDLLLAAYLWFFPMSVAHRLLPKTSGTEKIITNSNQIAVAGVALLGLYETVAGALGLFEHVAIVLSVPNQGSPYDRLTESPNATVFLYVSLLQLLIGVLLLLNARKVARFMTMR